MWTVQDVKQVMKDSGRDMPYQIHNPFAVVVFDKEATAKECIIKFTRNFTNRSLAGSVQGLVAEAPLPSGLPAKRVVAEPLDDLWSNLRTDKAIRGRARAPTRHQVVG